VVAAPEAAQYRRGWRHATEYIQAGFCHAMSLEQTQAVEVHPVHLARTLRRVVRRCGEYTRRLRLEDACKKLIASEKA
jgi:AraC-like DNA-binding protein